MAAYGVSAAKAPPHLARAMGPIKRNIVSNRQSQKLYTTPSGYAENQGACLCEMPS